MNERGTVIQCEGAELVAVYHPPANNDAPEFGLVIVVAGGPQYRVGAHRQFVQMARVLAEAGVPVLRFDHRGVGDSDGEYGGFLDMEADIRAAIDTLQLEVPSIQHVYLWGECESASAIAFYGQNDVRVRGLYMVNPWIRTEAGQAKTILKHYYFMRLMDKSFWDKFRSGKFSPRESLRSLVGLLKTAQAENREAAKDPSERDLSTLPLPERLPASIERFDGEVLILTSGHDLIAREFIDSANSSPQWHAIRNRRDVVFEEMTDADHTFTRPEWRQDLYDRTVRWTLNLEEPEHQVTS